MAQVVPSTLGITWDCSKNRMRYLDVKVTYGVLHIGHGFFQKCSWPGCCQPVDRGCTCGGNDQKTLQEPSTRS